jgi:hypothetical protein
MKKIFLSLLAVAATINVMAATYSAKATITLESQTSYESCQIILGQSDELNDGLNSGEYAEINMEGRSVALYVEYGGVKYQHFASSPATMKDLVLGAMTDAATSYTLTISNVSGAENFKLKIGDEEIDVVAGSRTITLAPNQTAAIGFVNPSAPAGPSICFNYNVLEINGHEGEALIVKKGADEIANVPALPAAYRLDLSAQSGRLVVTLNGVDYQIDANPAVKEVKP